MAMNQPAAIANCTNNANCIRSVLNAYSRAAASYCAARPKPPSTCDKTCLGALAKAVNSATNN